MTYKTLLLLLFCLCLAACGGGDATVFNPDGDDEAFVMPPPTFPPDKPPMPTESPWHAGMAIPEGYAPSRLTGLPIPEVYADARPIAVVINNIYKALPQSGISQADLLYEVLAEGDITRLVGIFQAHALEKIGPVRSARDYFIDFALDYDAVFVHHGGSPAGYDKLRTLRVDRLDGMALEGVCFRRERGYPDWYAHNSGTRPLEHSSYTASEPLRTVMADRGFRTALPPGQPFGFAFTQADSYRRAGGAARVTVPFSPNYTRVFTYDADTALYAAANRDGPQMDAETGEAVSVRNVLIQLVRTQVIAGDEAGRRRVETTGEGGGFLARDGYYERVTWAKDSPADPTRWRYLDGAEITLSVGRTWVCVFQENGTVNFEEEVTNE